MPQHADRTPMVDPPARHARGLFTAVLECWAGDCLRLRANGLDRPSWRTHSSGLDRPLGVRQSARMTIPARRAA